MRIFLATPFTGKIDPQNGRVKPAFERSVRSILKSLRAMGHTVFVALEREKWGEAQMPSEICFHLDSQEMIQCDVVVAIPGNPPSGGVHVELGWASSPLVPPDMRKPIILLLREEGQYSPLVRGLPANTIAIKIFYKRSLEETLIHLPRALSEVTRLCFEQECSRKDFGWRGHYYAERSVVR